MSINRHHRAPKLSEIDMEYIYDNYRATNDFFKSGGIYLGLPDVKKMFKVKDFESATQLDDVICVRSPTKLSAYYTLPSLFVLKSDLKQAKKLFINFVKEVEYTSIPKVKIQKIEKYLDILKNIDSDLVKCHKTIVIDMITMNHQYKVDLDLMVDILSKKGGEKYNSNAIKSFDIFYDEYKKQYAIKNKSYIDKILREEQAEKRRLELLAEQEALRVAENEKRRLEKERQAQKRKEELRLENLRKQKRREQVKILIKSVINDNYTHYLSQLGKDGFDVFYQSCLKNQAFGDLIDGDDDINLDVVTNIMNVLNSVSDVVDYVNNQEMCHLSKFGVTSSHLSKGINTFNNAVINNIRKVFIDKTVEKYPEIKVTGVFDLNVKVFQKYNSEGRLSMVDYIQLRDWVFNYVSGVKKYHQNRVLNYIVDKIESKFFINVSDDDDLMQLIRTEMNRLLSLKNNGKKRKKKSKEKPSGASIEKVVWIDKNDLSKKSILSRYNEIKKVNNHTKNVYNKRVKCQLDAFYKVVGAYLVNKNLFFSDYKDMFPLARKINRKLFYYSGVTNSGKTYCAFEEMKKYKNGLYLAPLRLLALEGQEEIEKRGMSCSMLTGEDRDVKEGANFLSCTIEMADFSKEYDIVVIDEIQMIKDRQRGSAWLQALVGIRAKKIILVGSPDIKDQVVFLSNYLKEPLEIINFERKTELTVGAKTSMRKRQDKGTAIIAFSQAKVFALKEYYESLGNSVSIIYGALPPELKRENSELFKNGDTDILVSTDAIAMGLNLPIKKIVFSDVQKYDGYSFDYITVGLLKQIAGRAGRYGIESKGVVSAFDRRDLDYIIDNINGSSKINGNHFNCTITPQVYTKISEIAKTDNPFEIVNIFKKWIKFDFIKTSITEEQRVMSKNLVKYKDVFSDNEIVKIIKSPFFDSVLSMNLVLYITNSIYKSRVNNGNISNYFSIERYNSFLKKSDGLELKYKAYDLLANFVYFFDEMKVYEEQVRIEKEKLSKKIRSYAVSRWLNKLDKAS